VHFVIIELLICPVTVDDVGEGFRGTLLCRDKCIGDSSIVTRVDLWEVIVAQYVQCSVVIRRWS